MNNVFEQYGIKEVANVTLYSIELDNDDNEIYIPVLYMDTLKVSTVEETKQQVSAQGGIGNPKLITWDYGKDITVTLEDALFTPASSSMNWGASLRPRKLSLSLRYFFDRNTDVNTPEKSLKVAKLTVDKFCDFMIIPDRWSKKEEVQCFNSHRDYIGGTSIYCWLVDAHIVEHGTKEKVIVNDLLLFYREVSQSWYFFNGTGPTSDSSTWYKTAFYDVSSEQPYSKNFFGIGYQYGQEVFNWIKENIANFSTENTNWTEYESFSNIIIDNYSPNLRQKINRSETFFLTENLYIDGYKKGCEKTKTYSETIDEDTLKIKDGYIPYRYFVNIGVEYNTNIAPPQDAVFLNGTNVDDIFMIEGMENKIADRTFCIDSDINLLHSQYRFLDKYSETPLTVFIDPCTMQPFQPNTYEYHCENGKKIMGNLTIIKKGSIYYKWSRTKAKKNRAIGKQILIDSQHFPGVYRLVGETYIRNRLGKDEKYQFEIPLCKLNADNHLTLEASGEPTVFTMKLNALRRYDGVMMKLTAYDILKEGDCGIKKVHIKDHSSPQRVLVPTPYKGNLWENDSPQSKNRRL